MKIPVCMFANGERSIPLALYCWEKLGYEVTVFDDPNESYSERLIRFFKWGFEQKSQYVIRTDADVFTLDIDKLIDPIKSDEDIWWANGMSWCRFRCLFDNTAPEIYHLRVMEIGQYCSADEFDKLDTGSNFSDLEVFNKPLKAMNKVNESLSLHNYEQYYSHIIPKIINRYNINKKEEIDLPDFRMLEHLHDDFKYSQEIINILENKSDDLVTAISNKLRPINLPKDEDLLNYKTDFSRIIKKINMAEKKAFENNELEALWTEYKQIYNLKCHEFNRINNRLPTKNPT